MCSAIITMRLANQRFLQMSARPSNLSCDVAMYCIELMTMLDTASNLTTFKLAKEAESTLKSRVKTAVVPVICVRSQRYCTYAR